MKHGRCSTLMIAEQRMARIRAKGQRTLKSKELMQGRQVSTASFVQCASKILVYSRQPQP